MSQGSTTFMKKKKTSFNKVCQTTIKSSPSLSPCLTPSRPPAPRSQIAQLVNPPPHPLSFPTSSVTSVTCQIPLPAEQPPLTLTFLEPPCGIMIGHPDYAFFNIQFSSIVLLWKVSQLNMTDLSQLNMTVRSVYHESIKRELKTKLMSVGAMKD